MKKKVLGFIFVICFMMPVVLLLTACGEGFNSNAKYVYSKVEICWANEQEKIEIQENLNKTEEEIVSMYEQPSAYLKFNEDGTVLAGTTAENEKAYYYTVEDDTIFVYSDAEKQSKTVEITIEGGNLTQTYKPDKNYNTYVKMTYVKE